MEMIQDRSFDAMALALGFKPGNATVPLRPPGADPARSHHQHHSRRLTAAAAAAVIERLPQRSGVVAGLASMLGMPLPLGFGQHEGASLPSPCDLPQIVIFRAIVAIADKVIKQFECQHTSGRGSLESKGGSALLRQPPQTASSGPKCLRTCCQWPG